MASPYRVLLTNSDAIVLVITSSVARLPQAMLSIGIITMLLQQGSLYWLAGAIAGTFTLANAVISPQVSKLVDQYGQSKVLPIITTFSMIMLLVFGICCLCESTCTISFHSCNVIWFNT